MAQDKQYREDSGRLAVLIEKYTNIPQDRVYQFVMENSAEKLLPYANKLCKTEAQKEKLSALFEFKNLYEIVKSADTDRAYRFYSSDDAKQYYHNCLSDTNDREYFAVTYLNARNAVIKTELSAGTVAQVHVYPREIVKEALFLNASSVMLAHNHPSGDAKPSKQDIDVTSQVKQGMELMGMKLLDHIIITKNETQSLLEMGHIPEGKSAPVVSGLLEPAYENAAAYRQAAKPPSIRQQLALAQEQLSHEQRKAKPQKQEHERGDR